MDENELAPRRVVALRDEETGDDLEMEVMVELTLEGREYALITPTAPVVHLFAVEDDGAEDAGALTEADDETYERMRRDLNEALAEWGVRVELRGGECRLSGELDEEVYGESEVVEFETEEDEEPETFYLLKELDTGGKRYWLVTPTDPPIYPAELVGEKPRLLEDDELERLEGYFRDAMAEMGEGEEDEGGEGGDGPAGNGR